MSEKQKNSSNDLFRKAEEAEKEAERLRKMGDAHGAHALQGMAQAYLDEAAEIEVVGK